MCSQDAPDVVARYDGTVGYFEPQTPRGLAWLRDNLPNAPRFGRMVCVDDCAFSVVLNWMRDYGNRVPLYQAGSTF
jgi:hypothetical protein